MPRPENIAVHNRKGQIMRFVRLQLAIIPAISAILFSATCFAADQGTTAISAGDTQAKVEYCQECHGSSGQGYPGVLPIPRIAGQTTTYIENQLLAFIESRRDEDVSITMPKIHSISLPMRAALAAHFSELSPEPIGDGPSDLVGAGKRIYAEGVPEANVAACSACHGPEAKGKADIPRLAGQLYPYTVKELDNWSKERGSNIKGSLSSAMAPIAHAMSHPQITAVAAYLSYLK
jgi:cytochrome c553